MDARHLAQVFRVLSVTMRVQIVQLLKRQPLCVNALATELGVTPGAVSQHLRVMRQVGLTVDERRGYHVHYRLNLQTIEAWRTHMNELLSIPGNADPEEASNPWCTKATSHTAEDERHEETR